MGSGSPPVWLRMVVRCAACFWFAENAGTAATERVRAKDKNEAMRERFKLGLLGRWGA